MEEKKTQDEDGEDEDEEDDGKGRKGRQKHGRRRRRQRSTPNKRAIDYQARSLRAVFWEAMEWPDRGLLRFHFQASIYAHVEPGKGREETRQSHYMVSSRWKGERGGPDGEKRPAQKTSGGGGDQNRPFFFLQ